MKFKRNIKILQIRILYFILNLFEKKPEQNIITAFVEKYPNSEYPVWHKSKDGSWQVSFDENQHPSIAVFANDGKWLGSRFFIQFLLLPQNVRDAFESQFNKEFIMGVYDLKFKTANLYEFLICENHKTKSVLFSTSGLLLNITSLIS